MDHVYFNFVKTVKIERWGSELSFFASCILKAFKEHELYPQSRAFDDPEDAAAFNICGFIDCKTFSTCTPGAGPNSQNPGLRRDPSGNIQQAYYNGWKSMHGVKVQCVLFPNGLIGDAYGAITLRRSDLYFLHESKINQRLAALQQGNDMQFGVYGDKVYAPNTHVVGGMSRRREQNFGRAMSEQEMKTNLIANAMRQHIELGFGKLIQNWKYIGVSSNLKLMESDVSKAILVSIILHNCYVCLNHSATAMKFECSPPSLEQYLS